MDNPPVTITITAQVTTSVTLSAGESLEALKDRYVDIYLHGPGEDGCYDKQDLGANNWTITTDTENKPLIVSRAMFLAEVDMTHKRIGGTLHNWYVSGNRVMGIIYNDDQWTDGIPLRTSTAISISEDRKRLETLNTVYTLENELQFHAEVT